MAVHIDEMTTVPAPSRSERGGDATAGGDAESPQPSEHDIERIVEMQANRHERIRAY